VPKIKTDEVLKTLKGTPIKERVRLEDETIEEKEVKVLELILTAVLMESNEDKSSSDEKMKRYRLAQKITKAQDGTEEFLSLSAEEAAHIKSVLGKTPLSPLVFGQISDLLDS